MTTVGPSSPPAGTADESRPVVLVAAATVRAVDRATSHAAHLFGDGHRVESIVVDDPASVVADLASERCAVAVVLGVDLAYEDRARRSTVHLVRSSPCPVVVVAIGDGVSGTRRWPRSVGEEATRPPTMPDIPRGEGRAT